VSHGGRHEAEISSFVKKRRSKLEHMPTAFLSVSRSDADAEDPSELE
jgi:menaquinone-dependent protoporphyrinogen IX oxidase